MHPNSNSRVLMISPDPRLARELRALLAAGLPATALEAVDSYPDRGALARLASQPGLRLALVEVSSDGQAAAATVAGWAAVAPDIPLVAVLPVNDPDLILRTMRQGASEFLIRPFTAEQLAAVLARTHVQATPAGPAGGRLVCVVPGKGASGATTLACNLAAAFKRRGFKRILLADLDGLTGTLPFVLKVKGGYSFLDALHHAGELDAEVWKALVTPWQGIDVLLSPESPLESIAQLADPAPLVRWCRQAYDLVIADTGGAYGDWNAVLAAAATDLLVVTTAELAVLHATQRSLARMDAGAARVVLNRHRAGVGLKPDEVATALGTDLFHVLPSEYGALHRAVIEGKPAAPATAYGKAVWELAGKMSGQAAENRKSSGWGGLLARVFA